MPHTLIEVWQANAAGRYAHKVDRWDAPLDPNFTGAGRTLTDEEGRYRFITIRPGAYPWRNHHNAWRPAHIHFSLFGQAFATRLVTQMYFPGDPLLPLDPIFNSVPDERARDRMVSPSIFRSRRRNGRSAIGSTSSCAAATRRRWNADMAPLTPFQTVGPFLHIGLRAGLDTAACDEPGRRAIVIRGRLARRRRRRDSRWAYWSGGTRRSPTMQRSMTE